MLRESGVKKTMAVCVGNYGSFWKKVPQTLIAGTSNAGSVYGVQCFLTERWRFVNRFLHPMRSGFLVISDFFRTFAGAKHEGVTWSVSATNNY